MKKILLVLTCIVAMAMMIVGCGGSDKKDAATTRKSPLASPYPLKTIRSSFPWLKA